MPKTESILDRMDREVISRAKDQLDACKAEGWRDRKDYLLGGCEEIIRQLIRVAERKAS